MASSLFARHILGVTPGAFELRLELASLPDPSLFVGSPRGFRTASVIEWTDDDLDADVLARARAAMEACHGGLLLERCELALTFKDEGGDESGPPVRVDLSVAQAFPFVYSIELARTNGSGAPKGQLVADLLGLLDLRHARRLKAGAGFGPTIWTSTNMARWEALTHLSLSSSGVGALDDALGALTTLQQLRLSNNKLAALPREVGNLKDLRVLVADHNQLSYIPVDLCNCSELRELNLEHNRLTTPLLDMKRLSKLQSLHLYGNPLEYFPELSVCTTLRALSLANLHVVSDAGFTRFEVQVGGSSNLSGGGQKLTQFFAIIFRRSSCQHALLAGALGRIAEYHEHRESIVREQGAIQQLILMSLSEDEVVQKQAAKVLGCLAEDPKMAEELFRSDVHTPMIGLMRSSKHDLQGGGLRVLASLALASDMVSACLLKSEMLEALQEMIRTPTAASVRHLALETLGNLAFSQDGKATLANVPGMRSMLIDLAEGRGTDVDRKTRVCSLRVLAILGQLDEVWRITGRPNVKGRGVRILTMDGGGMKGICTVALLREIERRTGRRISDLFDLIGGTSTGAMLGAAIGLRDFTLDQGADIYKKLGFKVFSQPEEEQPGWKESLYRMYRSGQQSIRVAMTGCKHDASTFEGLLQDFSSFPRDFCLNDAFIDTACLPLPRFFAVATLCTTVPSVPYLFRNYEFPPERNELVRGLNGCLGSSKHLVWEGIRASSAAPYYLVDFQIGDSRFQDGAVIANNPTAIAIQQARLLWPDAPIDCVVSLGVGSVPRAQREKSSSTLLENGSILIESACSVERVNEALLASLPMVPGLKYFRFNPVDVRCDMPLDSTDPEAWTRLEAATAEYIEQEALRFDEAATLLCSNLECSRSVATAPDASRVFLGSRRTITVVDCPLPGDTSWPVAVSKMCKGFTQCLYACTRGFPLEVNDESPSKEEQVRDSAAAQNVVPILHEPSLSDWNTVRQKHNALNSEVPQASGDCVGLQTCFDPSSMPKFAAKDDYPSGAPLSNIQTPFTKCDVALSGAASPDSFGEQLQDDRGMNKTSSSHSLQNLGSASVIHLGLNSWDGNVLVTEWDSSTIAMAEPGQPLSQALVSKLTSDTGCNSLAELCCSRRKFYVEGALYCLLAKHEVQTPSGDYTSDYMFQRTRPRSWIGPEDLIKLGDWRGAVVVTTSALSKAFVDSFLDLGVKSLVAPRLLASIVLSPRDGEAFFRALYGGLFGGDDLLKALKAAEARCPSLKDFFEIHLPRE